MTTRPTYIGAQVARVEDDRLLSGAGRFVADSSGCPQLQRARSDEHPAVSFHHRTVRKRLVALDIGEPQTVRAVRLYIYPQPSLFCYTYTVIYITYFNNYNCSTNPKNIFNTKHFGYHKATFIII